MGRDHDPRQLPLGVRLRDGSRFAGYFPGRNRQPVESLQALAPGSRPVVAWLCGPAGTGKTHLLQALCARAGEQRQSAAYFPLQQVAALGPGVLAGCGDLDWVCLDDAGAIAGLDAWEKALFALHTEFEESGGRLVVTASVPPAGLEFNLRDLASRLAGGMLLRLHPLDDAEQIAALTLRAAQRGLELPEETARYLLTRLPRDMHSLGAFLDALDDASLAAQRRLTVPFVSSVLKEQGLAG